MYRQLVVITKHTILFHPGEVNFAITTSWMWRSSGVEKQPETGAPTKQKEHMALNALSNNIGPTKASPQIKCLAI
jgi:hypothetical protein